MPVDQVFGQDGDDRPICSAVVNRTLRNAVAYT